MNRRAMLRECRRPAFKTWVGAALVAFFLLAESLAVTHPLDVAAHDNGKPCAVCISVTHLGHGAAAAAVAFAIETAAPSFVATVTFVFVSIVPTRRYARGPPDLSFAL
jgi:hypothetical protein